MQAARNEDLQTLVAEYNEFQLCREMGWTLETLRQQPASLVARWMTFLSAETEARERAMDKTRKAVRRG